MEVARSRLWAPGKIHRLLLTCDPGVQGEKKSAKDEGGKKKGPFHLSTFQRTKEEGYLISELEPILTKDDLPVGHRAPAQIV